MILYYALGRQAMCEGLRILGATVGSRIAVPRFICSDVVASLSHEGYITVPYEITRDLQADVASPRPTAEYIILVNYFGFAADVDLVANTWGFTRRQILEDNAHGLFSRDSNDCLLGQRTTVGFTSFRKSIRVRDGGMLLINDASLANIAEFQKFTPVSRQTPRSLTFRRLSVALSKRSGIPLMNIARGAKRKVLRTIPQAFDPESRVPSAVSVTSLAALRLCDATTESERRRALYRALVPVVEDCGAEILFDRLPDGVVPYALPFLAPQTTVRRVRRALWLRNLEVFPWPDLPPDDSLSPNWQHQLHLVSFLE